MHDWTYTRGPLRMWRSDERTIEALLLGVNTDQAGLYINKEPNGDAHDWSVQTRGYIDIIDIQNKHPVATVMRSQSRLFCDADVLGLPTDDDVKRFPHLIVEALEAAQDGFGVQFQSNPVWLDLINTDGAAEISSNKLSDGITHFVRGIFGHLEILESQVSRGEEARRICDRAMTVGNGGLVSIHTNYANFLMRIELTGDPDAPFLLHPVNPSEEVKMLAGAEIEAASVGDFLALSRLQLPTREDLEKEVSKGWISDDEVKQALTLSKS